MGTARDAEPSSRHLWPYTARAEQLAGALRSFGTSSIPASPLHMFAPSDTEGRIDTDLDARVRTDARFRAALLTLAAPERLLTFVAHSREMSRAALFLAGSSAVIGFAVYGDEIGFSAPMSSLEFAAIIRTFVNPPANDDQPTVRVPIALLKTLRSLFACGLDGRLAIEMTSEQVAAAGAGAPGHRRLNALVQGGVLTEAGDGYRLQDDWIQGHQYLVDNDWVELAAVELADVQSGFRASRTVSIVGSVGRQRIALADSPGSGKGILLAPLTVSLLDSTVVTLASPPRLPNVTVHAHRTHGVVTTTRRQPTITVGDSNSDWHLTTPEDLVAALHGGELEVIADAVFSSRHVVVTRRDPSYAASVRSVLVPSGGGIVEWSLEGSRVRWRVIERESLDELLPADPSTLGTARVAVFSSSEQEQSGGGGGTAIWFAADGHAVGWRLEKQSSGDVIAQTVPSAVARDEVLAALAA